MQHQILNQFNHVVAIGGGHGLGRVLSSLDFLGKRLTGIVATTDNGGSTGRLRAEQNCIAWGDLRNCLSHLANRPSLGSQLFEYRFQGETELSGHNLGNLILLALDQLCVRPLEAVNLIRSLLNIETQLIPMSEQPTHLVAIQACGSKVFGETNVDSMMEAPIALCLEPQVDATFEACQAVLNADLIIIGPGSFLTSIMPPLLLPRFAKSLAASKAQVIFIDNLYQELSPAGQFSLEQRISWCHQIIGRPIINKVLRHGDQVRLGSFINHFPLKNKHNPNLHDHAGLRDALSALLRIKSALNLQPLTSLSITK
ncbi:uridine diphosphate-N-acetylglucosamine-binding protein YvcK [Shewanella profunda]|uniref:uridine diphosphate-N-acetylglucosamine-binding protein YvcK n=1 Tax=Shewanella profunda TaxID=254793 RepID=UPI00200E9AB1|nr:uridine diphosphate-N-acetylglucosamine-binding protein YvcK [Shewanella profunda]MCL1088863.1 uridine diphosphate-N-acetylglucosamine-binding protein YvcK [Shewanella profunda]